MTLSLKVVLIVISILTCFYIARKLRKSQMNINDTVFWIFFALVLVLLSVFPGIAGPRVIEQTIGESLPEGFQTAEFLLEHGFIDKIVERKEMKDTISKLIEYHKIKNN